ncbi:MAG TPA: SNF2-related protein, partial [Candidatus Bathyarchaeia archaeon]|nr:SNF2-related protein [Candidatus Bathyarchaeia archaeon]
MNKKGFSAKHQIALADTKLIEKLGQKKLEPLSKAKKADLKRIDARIEKVQKGLGSAKELAALQKEREKIVGQTPEEKPTVVDVIESPQLEWESFLRRLSDEQKESVKHLIPKDYKARSYGKVKAQIDFINEELAKKKAEPAEKPGFVGLNESGEKLYEDEKGRYTTYKGMKSYAPRAVGPGGGKIKPYSKQGLYDFGHRSYLTAEEIKSLTKPEKDNIIKGKAEKLASEMTPDDLLAEWDRQAAESEPAPESEPKPTAKEKAKETVDHLKDAVSKFAEINKILGEAGGIKTGDGLDQKKWELIRPLLQDAWDSILAAGKSGKEFVKLVLENLSPKGRPYFEKFVREEVGKEAKDERSSDGSASTRSLEKDKSGNIPTDDRGQSAKGDERSSGQANNKRNRELDENRSPGTDGMAGEPSPIHLPDKGTDGEGLSTGTPSGELDQSTPASEPRSLALSGDNPGNYRITAKDNIGSGTRGQKIDRNIEAIRLVKTLVEEGRYPTKPEQTTLAKYVGWGGLKKVFDKDSTIPQDINARKELKEILTKDEFLQVFLSITDAHYTSPEIIGSIYDVIKHFGFEGGNILEPTYGAGSFIGLMPEDLSASSKWYGSELDPITAKIGQMLYPDSQLIESGFQVAEFPFGKFDLAIGNPPFGSLRIADTKKNRSAINRFKIHNYVISKEAMHLKPGGILANVITTRFLDTADTEARDFLSKNFKFLGAIRLPNDAFAKTAGTTVTTDLVFLQKLMPGEKADMDADWLTTGATMENSEGETITLNKYFANNPDMMLGEPSMKGTMYGGAWKEGGKGEFTLNKREGDNVADLIQGLIKNQLSDLKGVAERSDEKSDAEALSLVINKEDVGIGGFYTEDKQIYMRGDDDNYGNPTFSRLSPNTQWTAKTVLGQTRYDRIRGMLRLREMAYKLIEAERFDLPGIEGMRKQLNREYNKYVKKFGFLSAPANFKLMSDDIKIEFGLESSFKKEITKKRAEALGIEPMPATATKAAILKERVFYPNNEIIYAKNASDGYSISLSQKGRLDVDYVAKLTGKKVDEITSELSELGLAYQDPETNEWVQEDEYLSGNVKAKYKAAIKKGMEKNAEALKSVFPEDKTAENIYASVGATWVPKSVYDSFAEFIGIQGASVTISHDTGKVFIGKGFVSQNDVNVEWQNDDYDVVALFNAALQKKTLVAYDGSGDDRQINRERTRGLSLIVRSLRNTFSDWLFADPVRSELLVKEFNEKQNTHAKRKYSGKHLRTVGTSPAITLLKTQKNAAWRIIQSPVVLLDHIVGAGKTFTIITGIMERVRMGLTNKAIVVVPNHLVGQWSADWMKLYPGANILAATNKDFSKQNRRRLFSRITAGKYDAVIVGHSSFGFIPIESESIRKLVEEEVSHLERAQSEARAAGEKRTASGLAKRIQSKRERIVELMNKPRDNVSHFEEMGIDHLVVDESQEFKNLEYSTSMQNITGMGNPTGSKRAFDLYSKIRWLTTLKNSGITFATGTPISNSLVEMYALLRYLNRQGLVDRKLEAFDAWAGTYAVTENVIEYTASQRLKDRVVMTTFKNANQLLQLYEEFSDSVSMADLKRIFAEQIRESNRLTGKKDSEAFPVPRVKEGGRTIDIGEPDEAQIEYTDYLIARAERLESLGRQNDPKVDNHLWLMSDARKMALDVRLVDPTAKPGENNKINRAAKKIKTTYDKWHDDKGTQLVFCDLSTPLKTSLGDAKKLIKAGLKIAKADNPHTHNILDGMATYWDRWKYINHLIESEIESISESYKSETDAFRARRESLENFLNEKADDSETAVFTTVDSRFSVYDDLKSTLIRNGIPAGEIRFIHEANTPIQKDELFDLVNAGAVRVLIGSTPKMGAGTNVQERLVGEIHMDAPWRPSDVEQREGRIIRQGNNLYLRDPKGFEVDITAFSTGKTFDAVMWQILARKQGMLDDFRNGSDTIDDKSNDSASYADFMAETTGNPAFKEKFKLEGEIEELAATQRRVKTRRRSAEQSLDYSEKVRASKQAQIELWERASKKLEETKQDTFSYDGKEYVNNIAEEDDKERDRIKDINKAEEERHSAIKNMVLDEVTKKYPDWQQVADLHKESLSTGAISFKNIEKKKEYEKAVQKYYDERLKEAGINHFAKTINFDRNKIAKKNPKGATAAAVKIMKEIKYFVGIEDGTVDFKVGDVDVRIDISVSDRKKGASDFEFYVDGVLVYQDINSSTFYFSQLEKFLSADKTGRVVKKNIQSDKTSIEYYKSSDVTSRQTLEKLQFKDDEKLAEKKKRYAEVVDEVNALEEQMTEQRGKRKNKYIADDVDRFSGYYQKESIFAKPQKATAKKTEGLSLEDAEKKRKSLLKNLKKAIAKVFDMGVDEIFDPATSDYEDTSSVSKTIKHAENVIFALPNIEDKYEEPWKDVLAEFERVKEHYLYKEHTLDYPRHIGERPLYSSKGKTGKTSAERVLDTVIPYIQGMTNFPTVRVVQSIDQLPKRLKDRVSAFSKKSNKQVEGFYDKVDDQVFLISENLSEDRIAAVLRHEAEGHRGIRLLLGSELNAFLDGVAKLKLSDILKENPSINLKDQEALRVAADEWVARKIEAGNLGKSFWDGLVRAFRKWLRGFIPNLDLSNREIQAVLADAVKNVREGRVDRIKEKTPVKGALLFSSETQKPIDAFPEHVKPEIEAARGLEKQSFLTKIKEGSKEALKSITPGMAFPGLPTKQYGQILDSLRLFKEVPTNARRTAMRDIKGIIGGLNADEYDTFSYRILVGDMLSDIDSEKGPLADWEIEGLPFGFKNR